MIFIGCTIRLRLYSHICIHGLNTGGLHQCTTTDFQTLSFQYHNLKTMSFYLNHATYIYILLTLAVKLILWIWVELYTLAGLLVGQ